MPSPSARLPARPKTCRRSAPTSTTRGLSTVQRGLLKGPAAYGWHTELRRCAVNDPSQFDLSIVAAPPP